MFDFGEPTAKCCRFFCFFGGYVFTSRSPYLAPSGGHRFLFYGFTDLILYPTSGPFGDPFLDCQKGGKSNQRAPKPPFGFWLFIRGFGEETCGLFYVCAGVQLTRFRPVRWRAVGFCLLFAIAKAIASTASTGLMLTAVPRSRYCLQVSNAPQ